MPRKKKIADKDANEKNNAREKALDELAVRLKLNKENKDLEEAEQDNEESELEEDIDDLNLNLNLNLQGLEFHQFMHLAQDSTETGAPVLERIAGSQPRPIFVGGIPRETTVSGGADSKDEFKYVPGTAENGEIRYFAEPGIGNAPERLDLTRVGRTGSFREEISQERFFTQSEPKIESQSMERFERPERFDIEQAGRRNPSEREERKYRPKLPKS